MKQNSITWEQALSDARTRLEEAPDEAWVLLEYAGNITRLEYILHCKEEIPADVLCRFKDSIRQREAHIPLQYITGCQEFMGIPIEVSPAVLIPRQDTEILAELVIKEAKGKNVLDLCTGSGCLAVSIAKLGETKKMTAVDISQAALALAEKNAALQKTDIQFIKSNMFQNVIERYDIIVSNPPYIPTKEIEELMPEVRDHEPHLALDGTDDGLYFYRIIAEQAGDCLNNGGKLFLEIGCDQAEQVSSLLEAKGFYDIKIHKDLAGLDRVIIATAKKNVPLDV